MFFFKFAKLAVIVVVLWLAIGAAAAWQRGYFESGPDSCAKTGTTIVTVLAGVLNYVGANPKISCELPQPSK